MAKYRVTFNHKISSTCKCGHGRSDHAGEGANFGTGACNGTGSFCAHDCSAFENGDVQNAELPSATVESGDHSQVTRALRQARLLQPRQRILELRRKDGRLTVWPAHSIWQSLVIEPIADVTGPGPSPGPE
jgi:hypothetical protein